jgi:hypothetical protein
VEFVEELNDKAKVGFFISAFLLLVSSFLPPEIGELARVAGGLIFIAFDVAWICRLWQQVRRR